MITNTEDENMLAEPAVEYARSQSFTTDIMRNINQLPIAQRMLIVERIIHSIRQQEQQSLKKAAEYLYADYLSDQDLTIFTQLDCENFYEPRFGQITFSEILQVQEGIAKVIGLRN